MPEAIPLTVTLYGRPDCKLCDEVREALKGLEKRIPHRLVEIDIDSDPVLQKAYFDQIPVVEVGPYKLKAPISKQALEMTLGAARDRRGQLVEVGGAAYEERLRKSQAVTDGDRFSWWLSKHYLALLNLLVFIYVGLPFLAPTLMKFNQQPAARLIYTVYSPLCHQLAYRSFFLFGEQPYYPLKAAGVPNVKTFDQITGTAAAGLVAPGSAAQWFAKLYTGDPVVGYKVAICERDVAIYGAIVLFGLIYALTNRRLPALHWMLWILIGLGPIGLDGFSQLFSQYNWAWLAHYLPYRESTPFLRVLTGSLFGFMTAWFAYPNIEESMRETREIFIKKFAVAKMA